MPDSDQPWQTRAAAQLDASLEPVPLPRDLLAEVFQHARECYPEECCGLLLGRGEEVPTRVVRCTNVQSTRVARGESDLDARRAFWIDEQELLNALRGAEQRGERLVVIYHSHVDTAAYLSHTDLAGALGPDGRPLYPGVAQLVISVQESRVLGAALFAWDDAARRFVGRAVR
ncbi:MAG: M67 family metallopeptidase [Myxococcota bacterium]